MENRLTDMVALYHSPSVLTRGEKYSTRDGLMVENTGQEAVCRGCAMKLSAWAQHGMVTFAGGQATRAVRLRPRVCYQAGGPGPHFTECAVAIWRALYGRNAHAIIEDG